ncbi:MAG: lipopolysaccharide biosynthesis protein [Parvibaculaceae bacterium]
MASTLDLVSFAIVARILSAEYLGLFLIALAVGTIIERLGSPNLAQTFMRHAVRAIEKRQPGDLRRLLELAALFEFSLLGLGLASGLVTAAIIAPAGDHTTFAAIVITVMFAALRPPLLAVAIPRAFGHHQAVSGWLLLGALMKVAILLAILLVGGGIFGVAIAFTAWRVVAAAGGLAITATQARRHGALSVQRSDPEVFAANHEEFWTLARAGAITALPQAIVEFSTVLMGIISGVTAAGVYRLATKVGEAARIYTNPISFVVYADQCKAVEKDDLHRLWTETIRWSAYLGIITGLGALAFVAARTELVTLAFGEGYDAAVPAITWAVIAAVPYSASVPAQFALFALGVPKHVLRAESIAAILFLAIIVFLRTPDAEQAAIALALSRAAALVAFAVFFLNTLRQRAKWGEAR